MHTLLSIIMKLIWHCIFLGVIFTTLAYFSLRYHQSSFVLFGSTHKHSTFLLPNLSQKATPCGKITSFEMLYKKRMEKTFPRIKQNINEIKFVRNFPLLIHFIWISHDITQNNTVDEKIVKNIETFHMYEKDGWKIMIWDNNKIRSNYCPDKKSNEELCDILTNLTLVKRYNLKKNMKADLLRYIIIHDFGGMYFDCDFIAVRNMNHILLHEIKRHGLILVREPIDPFHLANEFFAAAPQNICIEKAKNWALISIKSSLKNLERTGPRFFIKAVLSAFFKVNIHDRKTIKQFNLSSIASVLPTDYLYAWPYPKRTNKTMFQEVKSFPTTYFMHLWAASWQKTE